MNRIVKLWLIWFTIFVLAGVVYFWGLVPLQNRVIHNVKQVQLKKAELHMIQTKIKQRTQLEYQLQEAEINTKNFTESIPSELTIADIYYRVDSLAGECGLKVKQISAPQTFMPFAKDSHLKYISIDIEGAAYFAQVIKFLDLISKSTLLMQVEKFELNSVSKNSKARIDFKIILNIFEYSS